MFVDEFSELFDASDTVRNEVLRTFREIRNNRDAYAIRSIVIWNFQHHAYVRQQFCDFTI
jgi:hypothetical protein